MDKEPTIHSTFKDHFKGKFYGVLRWEQLDHVWSIIKSNHSKSWYIYDLNQTVPTNSLENELLNTVIDEIDKHLRKEHDEDYCGIVYVDDLESPEFIKIYDPNSLGSSCTIAKTTPLPRWVISKARPESLVQKEQQSDKPKRRYGKLFSK